MEIKVGDKLKAKDTFRMDKGVGNIYLHKGNIYNVMGISDDYITVVDAENDPHEFDLNILNDFFELPKQETKTDAIVESVITKYLNRSKVGIKKYGNTLEENNKDNFLNHLQEELFDASLYIEKLMSQQQENITNKVLDWAEQRDLIHIENVWKQYGKLQEESLELYNGMLDDKLDEIEDALGDIGVVMIILSRQLGFDFFKCIEQAYEVIKNRKGKTINGTFVKDEA